MDTLSSFMWNTGYMSRILTKWNLHYVLQYFLYQKHSNGSGDVTCLWTDTHELAIMRSYRILIVRVSINMKLYVDIGGYKISIETVIGLENEYSLQHLINFIIFWCCLYYMQSFTAN
jgi:hypothetical protein